jgi:hypothetical protein
MKAAGLAGKKLLSFIICCFFLAGCSLKFATTLGSDGTIGMGFVASYLLDERANLEAAGIDIQALCKEPLPGILVEPVEDEGVVECSLFRAYASLEDLRKEYEDTGYVTVNRLEQVDRVLYYDVSVDLSKGQFSGLDPGIAQIEWHLITPGGSIRSHNADVADTVELIWNLSPAKTTRIQAEVAMNGLASNANQVFSFLARFLCLGGGILGVIIAAALAFLIARRSKKDGL